STADIRYLLAESYAGAALQDEALALYTQLGFTATEQGTLFTAQDAAYKALLLSEKLAQQHASTAQRHWQLQTDFVNTHRAHPAAQQVALQQLQQRDSEQDYYGVVQHSNAVTDWPLPAQSQSALVQEAQFLHSQSELALQQYAAAEHSISAQLSQGAADLSADRRKLLTEQLASSIYQQAQQPDAPLAAVQQHLQRLLSVLPDSAYHEAAAYQQVEMARSAGDYAAAISLLTTFLQRYPDTERTSTAKRS